MPKSIPFTQEQIRILEENIYTHHVTRNGIVFTVAFKEFFAEQAALPGMTTKEIMRAAGYDPDFFPRASLDSLRRRILQEAASPEGFKSPRGLSSGERTAQFAAKDLAKQRADTSIKELQERVVHLEQQIEFLKKISHIRSNPKRIEEPDKRYFCSHPEGKTGEFSS